MMNQPATWRSARFSARVPGTGNRSRSETTSRSSIWLPRRTRSSVLIWASSSSDGMRGPSCGLRGRVSALIGAGHWRDPIHREIPMRAARPTKNATTPSGTGPKPPSPTPPGSFAGFSAPTDLM